ncbi:hypothetical protein F5884DRAFT_834630 [Xylogone sp. PMI_703]|nr:hypothetical protein F5884DRAFT_834630 [Xylogone sp. PMI_703]
MPQSKFSPDSLPDLRGKVYLVTGGNAGIGKATTIGLARQGATVYMGARSEEKARSTIEDIRKEIPDADIQFLYLDLTNLKTIVQAARELRSRESSLHGLINNAGVMAVPFSKTTDGYEVQFQTNYLAHWLLTSHLLPLLLSTAASLPGAARIINITSDGHRFAPKSGIQFNNVDLESESAMTRYGQSKLANILHTKELHRRYNANGVWSFAVHPGHIDTNLNKQATGTAPSVVLRTFTPLMRCLGILDDQTKGALSTLYAVASDGFESSASGSYIVPYAKISEPTAQARDAKLAEDLWAYTHGELEKKGFLQNFS